MTPEPTPDPDPDPDPPTPTGNSVKLVYQGDYSSNSIWLQTGSTWGDNIVASAALNSNGAETTVSVPNGDYYVYAAGPYASNDSTYVHMNSTVAMTFVTNGSLKGWKSNSKLTINGNATITVRVMSD